MKNPRPVYPAFTLIELLTVIGIISLLISVLLPSLSRARGQARRVKDQAILAALDKGLEMFHNDFDGYPDSAAKDEVIEDFPGGTTEPELMGAHWLARAMAGHDFQGLDTKGYSLHGVGELSSNPPGSGNIVAGNGSDSTIRMSDLTIKDRHGVYIEGSVFMRDTDPKLKDGGAGDYEPTGRPLVIGADGYPILYYRANSRSRQPFSVTGNGTNSPGSFQDTRGVYNQSDNGHITGGYSPDDGSEVHKGWDFAAAGRQHGLGSFGDLNNPVAPPTGAPFAGKTFVHYFEHGNSRAMGSVLRPQNPDTYVLISPGADGLFGTADDVNNLHGSQ